MKKSKLISFIVRGKAVEQIGGDEIDLDEVENMKIRLAFIHGVSFDEVEFEAQDVLEPELSTSLAVNEQGELVFKANQYAIFMPVGSIRPALDISHESLFLEFLDLLAKRDFDNALIFIK